MIKLKYLCEVNQPLDFISSMLNTFCKEQNMELITVFTRNIDNVTHIYGVFKEK